MYEYFLDTAFNQALLFNKKRNNNIMKTYICYWYTLEAPRMYAIYYNILTFQALNKIIEDQRTC